jgi:putative restriction endonuclease
MKAVWKGVDYPKSQVYITEQGVHIMKCVKNWDEIRTNLLTLEEYRVSVDVSLAKYYRDLIRRGECFIVYVSENKTLFGPSRFLGYANNTRIRHDRNEAKSGIVTNTAIRKVLKSRFLPDTMMEKFFQVFCRKHGINPAKRQRKFIQTGSTILTDMDLLMDDVSKIKAQRNIKDTERDQLVAARIGQGLFRQSVLAVWRRCAITRCKVPALLRASHIKPWRACNNTEKLDPFNGIILSPNLDAAFDQGFITFDQQGKLTVSRRLPSSEAKKLGISAGIGILIKPQHEKYLNHHRKYIFQE